GKGISSGEYESTTGIVKLTYTDNSSTETGDLRGADGVVAHEKVKNGLTMAGADEDLLLGGTLTQETTIEIYNNDNTPAAYYDFIIKNTIEGTGKFKIKTDDHDKFTVDNEGNTTIAGELNVSGIVKSRNYKNEEINLSSGEYSFSIKEKYNARIVLGISTANTVNISDLSDLAGLSAKGFMSITYGADSQSLTISTGDVKIYSNIDKTSGGNFDYHISASSINAANGDIFLISWFYDGEVLFIGYNQMHDN
ncbi:MAG: hypothetical protein HRT66_02155, partial [Flavobacteriaceae bacterium]|nr:hypothetical protein [Flavobacteriaceae bacterium]